jgi:hypothetical protein
MFAARMSGKEFLWKIMDFTMEAGIRMMGKEKLIAVRDRGVIVMKKITVRIRHRPTGNGFSKYWRKTRIVIATQERRRRNER